jgi:UDP-N-acetylmuramoylalanine--D-glutamate ligase
VIGITGTKGKSTTSSLIHHILISAGVPAEIVGNIGRPPLALIDDVPHDTFFVHEFSSHQLAEIETSPHIAVLLNIVPEHLDYYATFDEYVSAKENITRFQSSDDFLVFTADYAIPTAIAQRSKATLRPIHFNDRIDDIIVPEQIPLPGREIQSAKRRNGRGSRVAVWCGTAIDGRSNPHVSRIAASAGICREVQGHHVL